jgi:hypothetical protein
VLWLSQIDAAPAPAATLFFFIGISKNSDKVVFCVLFSPPVGLLASGPLKRDYLALESQYLLRGFSKIYFIEYRKRYRDYLALERQ